MTAGDEIRDRAEQIAADGAVLDNDAAAEVRSYVSLCRSEADNGTLCETDRELLLALSELIFDDDGSSHFDSKKALRLQTDIYRLLAESGEEAGLTLKCGYLDAVDRFAYEATVVPEEKFEENAEVLEYLNAAFAFCETFYDEEKQDVSVRVKLSVLYERIGILYSNFDLMKALGYYKQSYAIFKGCRDEIDDCIYDLDYDSMLYGKGYVVDMIYSAFFDEEEGTSGTDCKSLDKAAIKAEWIAFLKEWLPLAEGQPEPEDPEDKELLVTRYELLADHCGSSDDAAELRSGMDAYGRLYLRRHMNIDKMNAEPPEFPANEYLLAGRDMLKIASTAERLGMESKELFALYYSAHKDLIQSMKLAQHNEVYLSLAECYFGLGRNSSGDMQRMALRMASDISFYIRKKTFFKDYFEPENTISKYIGAKNSEGMSSRTTVSFIKSYYRHLKLFTDSLLNIFDHDYASSCFGKLIGYCREAEEQGGGDEAKLYLFLSVSRFVETALDPEMELYISHFRREDAVKLKREGKKLYKYLNDRYPGSELEEAYERLNKY